MNILEQLKDKIVLFDFDGVLCTYRADKLKTHVSEDEYLRRFIGDKDVYYASWAPETVKNIVSKLNPDNVYVLSDMAHTFELRKKTEFIGKEYPSIKPENILFTRSNYKGIVIDEMYNQRIFGEGYSKSDIILIDDQLDVIQLVEELGYTCYHVSLLL